MFEQLFKRHRTRIRHRNAPLPKERELFLKHLADQGWSRRTIYSLACDLRFVAERIDWLRKPKLTLEDVRTIADRCAQSQVDRGSSESPVWTRRRLERALRKWLTFIGKLESPPSEDAPGKEFIEAYETWTQQDCGLSSATIYTNRWSIRHFFAWYVAQNRPLSKIRPDDIDSYVVAACKNWSRRALGATLGRLRSFFLYAERQSWCIPGIADSIEKPRSYRHENIPLGPRWTDVKRLLDSVQTNNAYDIRDRAIMLLLAIYGLRRGEVVRLRLIDFDWETELLHIPRHKSRKRATYPLIRSVGDAVIRYLKKVRPQCDLPEIFLAQNAPIRPLAAGSISTIVTNRMKALGIQSPHFGPHSLRHACATHLVSERFSYKEIGDHLGHRSPISTRVYAKVDLEGLRQVAALDLGGIYEA